MAVAIHLIIHGRVQGVGYRSWTVGRARAHGLSGWVRNRREGTVEAVFCGKDETVRAMCAECRKGPLAARVTDIEEKSWSGEQPKGFTQLPTE